MCDDQVGIRFDSSLIFRQGRTRVDSVWVGVEGSAEVEVGFGDQEPSLRVLKRSLVEFEGLPSYRVSGPRSKQEVRARDRLV